ncbi:aspartate/glutamate racemase family protein [Pseudomonas sp. BN414]|uniref:aspartate/glutamate racemase family protein n=1 Tax=Pseudomonas sp. BN414 TaxID=2567888 RepID=UPI0024547B02|nr:aspartate/glutamate racemase family protein [Pseudomonas sp. BN414]MDH4569915.1 aspartate/glutamate racemase family protein [Pseudomonas sp. BN414]
MKIQLINPNTSVAMTSGIAEAASHLLRPGNQLLAVTNSAGPASIEGHYDEALSVPGLLQAIRDGERDGAEGHVIACFGDPGLLAAREIARFPVIGIAEAAMHLATWVATGFSVVTTLGRTKVIARHLVERYGFHQHCRGIHAVEIPVLALDEDPDGLFRIMRAACLEALERDESGAIVLGCAGMSHLAAALQEEIGVPVIDGVSAALKMVELLGELRLSTSKRGDLDFPLPKPYAGFLRGFAVGA